MNKREFLKSAALGTILLPISSITGIKASTKSMRYKESHPYSSLLVCSYCNNPLSITKIDAYKNSPSFSEVILKCGKKMSAERKAKLSANITKEKADKRNQYTLSEKYILWCTHCVKTPVIVHKDCNKVIEKFIELTKESDTGMPLRENIKKSDQTGENNSPVVTLDGLPHY